MVSYKIVLVFTLLIMTMVGCSHGRTRPRRVEAFRIQPDHAVFTDCVHGFVRVGVKPLQAKTLCSTAMGCNIGGK
jgi:hypothetical protein